MKNTEKLFIFLFSFAGQYCLVKMTACLNEGLRLFIEPLKPLWRSPGPHCEVAEGSCHQILPEVQKSAAILIFVIFNDSMCNLVI